MKETPFIKKIGEFSRNLRIEFVKKIIVFDTLDSTNGTAKDLAAAGAEEGTVVLARRQQHGRGRFDRIWESPDGGMYLSLILRPQLSPDKISLLPLVAGLAVAKTVDSYGLHTTIKWPNDVLVNGKKIAGILLESEGNGQSIRYVVVGIGMNINIDMMALSTDIRYRSTSILQEKGTTVEYLEVLKRFLTQFEQDYLHLLHYQYDSIIHEWKKRSDTLGKQVQVRTPIETIQGVAIDIDESGFLLLRTEQGTVRKIYSGDCL
jgi:BirA family biotin operon repressor/biotin-[acetyl-CoA-carboxylase] ligase